MSDFLDPRLAEAEQLFFVIGSQKSGTTWISSYCKNHPQIAVPLWKENNYWNHVEGTMEPPSRRLRLRQQRREAENFYRKLRRRLGLVSNSKKERAITKALNAAASPEAPHAAYADVLFDQRISQSRAFGEICPQYELLRTETFREMANLSQNVQFILIMRDPVERMISNIRHSLRKSIGRERVKPETVIEELGRELGNSRSVALKRSRYNETIQKLESAVPANSITYFFYETFFDQKEVDRLCHAIGVDPMSGDTNKVVNQGAGANHQVPTEMRERIAEILAPTYSAMQEKFGDRIPSAWMHPAKDPSTQSGDTPAIGDSERPNQPQPELPDDRH